MKTLAIAAAALLAAANSNTHEVTVGTSPTAMGTLTGRAHLEIQNIGPGPIYCAVASSADAVVGKARRIDIGAAWALDSNVQIYCVASVAQVTGAATIVTELR